MKFEMPCVHLTVPADERLARFVSQLCIMGYARRVPRSGESPEHVEFYCPYASDAYRLRWATESARELSMVGLTATVGETTKGRLVAAKGYR